MKCTLIGFIAGFLVSIATSGKLILLPLFSLNMCFFFIRIWLALQIRFTSLHIYKCML